MNTPRSIKLRRASGWGAVSALVFATVGLAGCARGCTSSRPPIHLNPSMDDQPKVRPQTASPFFYNGASMREPVPGTVPIGGLKEDAPFFTGKGADGNFVATIPVPVNETLVERGRERYRIYCQPCHDARGDGKGVLFQRGNVPTASFHQDKILKYGDGQIFDVITNGTGLMSGYRWPIPPADRWAIVAHVRELQRKRSASASESAKATADRSAKATADKQRASGEAGSETDEKGASERVGGAGRLRAPGASAFARAPADRRSLGGGWPASLAGASAEAGAAKPPGKK